MSKTTPAIQPNPSIVPVVLHEDADILIVDKQAGLVTQPGKAHANDSLLNGLFAMHGGQLGKLLQNLGVRRDFGLLHRLDRDTSGLLVVGKTPAGYDQLRRDFEERRVDKEYLALVAGVPSPLQGVIQARLKEVQIANPSGYGTIKKAVISRQGQEAITAYHVLSHTAAEKREHPAALLRLIIKTGRLHQIRAHMLFLNCQVLGDELYMAQNPPLPIKSYARPPRLCLHAWRLGFKHPATQKFTHFETPFPQDLAAYAAKIGLSTTQILPPHR